MADAGLKCLQWLLRGVQLFSSALILSVYSYFLATLAAHDFDISTSIRAVEGISGSGVLYGILGVLLACCVGGFPLASVIAIVLDTAFFGCFVYVAVANKHGGGGCKGEVDTPYGKGLARSRVKGRRGSLALPTYRVACQLQTACLAAAVISIVFYFISCLVSIALSRQYYKKDRRENEGYGYSERGFLGRSTQQEIPATTPDNLPTHPQPEDMSDTRSSHIHEWLETQTHRTSDDERALAPSHNTPPYPC
ncbi:hypothetical protein ACJ41O_014521 [Fusarium nematophilum]